MKVTLDTKFNIGDTVYVVDHYYDYYVSHTPYMIIDVLINVNKRGTHIFYEVEQNDVTDRVPESWTFNTYEECARWCEEHNRGVKWIS